MVWIGLLISAICLWLAMRNIPFHELGQILVEANYIWLIPAILIQVVAVIVRSWRWVLLLDNNPTFFDGFWSQGIGYLFTNILPLRLGEPARIFVMSQKSGLPIAQVTATAIVERLFDIATMILFLIIVLPFINVPKFVADAGILFGSLVLFAFVVILLTVRFIKPNSPTLRQILDRIPLAPTDMIIDRWSELLIGLRTITTITGLIQITLSSVLTWLLSSLVFFFVILAFQPNATLIEAIFVIVAVSLAIAVPSSPGFIGVFQFVGQQALVIPFEGKYTEADSLGIMILTNLIYYIITTFLGVVALWQLGLSFEKIRNAMTQGKDTQTIETIGG